MELQFSIFPLLFLYLIRKYFSYIPIFTINFTVCVCVCVCICVCVCLLYILLCTQNRLSDYKYFIVILHCTWYTMYNGDYAIYYVTCPVLKPHGIYNVKMNPKMLLLFQEFPSKKGCILHNIYPQFINIVHC